MPDGVSDSRGQYQHDDPRNSLQRISVLSNYDNDSTQNRNAVEQNENDVDDEFYVHC